MKRLFIGFVTLLLFMVTSLGMYAQDDVPVTGNADSDALQVVQDFLQSRDPSLLAGDVEFVDRTAAFTQPAVGPDLVTGPDGLFFGDMFTNVTITPTEYIVADNTVVAEFQYNGVNTGPYFNAPATGQTIAMPMLGVFEIADGSITSIRLYYDTATLQSQLGLYNPAVGPAVTGPAVTGPAVGREFFPVDVDDVVENPDTYFGRIITVRGEVDQLVGQEAFTLADQDLIDFDQEYMLVIPENPDDFQFIPVEGVSVNITGTVRDFVQTEVESDLGRELDDTLFVDYEDANYAVMIASSFFSNEDVENLDTLIDNPDAFIGRTVTVEANVGERLRPHTMYLVQEDFIGEDRILGIDVSGEDHDFNVLEEGTDIFVTGTVRNFVRTDIEGEYGVVLNEDLFADFENQPVFLIEGLVREATE